MYEQLYVLKNGKKLGPFSRATIQTDWAIGLYDGTETVLAQDGEYTLKPFLDQGTTKTEEEKKIENMVAELPKPDIPPPTMPSTLPPPTIPPPGTHSSTPKPLLTQSSRSQTMRDNGVIPDNDDDDDNEEASPEYIRAQKMLYACALDLIPMVGSIPAWFLWKRYKVLAAGYQPEDSTPDGQLILDGKKIAFYGLVYSVLSTFFFIASWGTWPVMFKLPLIIGLSVVAHGWVLTKICGVLLDQEYRLVCGILMSLRIISALVILNAIDWIGLHIFGILAVPFITTVTSLVFLALSCFIIMASSDIFRIQNISGGKQIITGLLAGFSLGLIFKLFLAII